MRGVNKNEGGFYFPSPETPRYLVENNPKLRRVWRRAETRQDYFYSHLESQEIASQECAPFNRESFKDFYWR